MVGRDDGELNSKGKEEIAVVLHEACFTELMKAKQVNTIMKNIYSNWDESAYFKLINDMIC